MKMCKRIIVGLLLTALVVGSVASGSRKVSAAATDQAVQFLKGDWVTAGNSAATVIVFTKKYAKYYTLWNKSNTKVTTKKRYTGRTPIVYTKKKGKKWKIKLKNGIYYIGSGDVLTCHWKDKNGEWQYSGSDSVERR